VDRETLIRTLVAAVIILGLLWGYQYLSKRAAGPERPAAQGPAETPPQTPPPQTPPPETPAVTAPQAPPEATTPAPAAGERGGPALQAIGAAAGAPAEPAVIGSARYENNPFNLEAEVEARGGAVRRLTLARHCFFKTVADRWKENPDEREPLDLVLSDAAFPAMRMPLVNVRLAGAKTWSTVDLSEVDWRIRRPDDATVVAEVDVQAEGGGPVLLVRKTFALARAKEPGPAMVKDPLLYGLGLRVEFVDTSTDPALRPEKVQYVLQSPPALPREASRRDERRAVAGMWTQGKLDLKQLVGKDIKPEEPVPAGRMPTMKIGGERVYWAGQADKYFAVIVIPGDQGAAGFAAPPETPFVAEARAIQYTQDGEEGPMAEVQLVTGDLLFGAPPAAPTKGTGPAGTAIGNDYLVFAGPKEPEVLAAPPYAAVRLDNLIIWYACCISIPGITEISKGMTIVLNAFYGVVHNYGIAIIILVVLLRVLLHPVTRWSTRSMGKMQSLGPKMQRLREEFGDDKQHLNQEMMRLYREEGVNPVGGCLPMFIQMPVWIGLYGALLVSLHLRHAAFIPASWLPQGSVFLQDLAQPDALVSWTAPVGQDLPLIGWVVTHMMGGGITSFNILPILMAFAMWLQQRLTPTAAAGPQAEQQKKMMGFMMVFFVLILYSAPAGLCLYIATSSLMGFFEQRYLKKKYAVVPGAAGGVPAAAKEPVPPKKSPYLAGKSRSFAERIRQRIAPDADKAAPKRGKRRK